MARTSFQTKLFLATFATAFIALSVAGVLFAVTTRRQTNSQVEQTLRAEARLVADVLSADAATAPPSISTSTLDAEADRLGQQMNARVTFIAADGAVLGDSAEPLEALASMENHATRGCVTGTAT